MKLMKRALALLLCFLMLTNGPINAFATEGVSDNDIVVVETTAPTETTETCEECGGSDAHTDTCSFNIAAPLTTDTPTETTEPTTTPTETSEPTVTPTVATGPAISTEPVGCTECNQTEGHLETCSQYIDSNACAECNQADSHAETCSKYEAPVSKCEHCGIELIEGAVHLETCQTLCTCEPVEGVHQEGCTFYVAPVEEIDENSPQIGDKIWIKSGSWVYKNHNNVDEDYHELKGNYEIKVVEILTDETGAAEWYKFEFTNLGVGEFFLSLGGYKYVHVDNTSVEEPTDEPVDKNACTCEYPPESGNIADHVDSCPRKQYIRTLFEGKTAEEIYAQWETYDEATQTDLLNMLQKWDKAKYEELKSLVDKAPDGEKETTVGDISLKVQGVPEGVELGAETVAPKSWNEDVFDAVGSKKVVFAIDITLTGADGKWQPADGESVTVTLDAASLGLTEGERIGILHDHEGALNDLGICIVTDGKLTFTTNGFSVFYGYTVDFEYDGTWYSIGGGSDIFLYELFPQLGINRSSTSVSSVTFSDPSLLSVSREVVDGYTLKRDWYIKSLQPFNTEEVMTITFSDGSQIQINVYDATYTTLSNNLTLKNGDVINGATVSGSVTVKLNGTVTIKNQITVPEGTSLTITGNGTLKRDSSYIGRMFSVTGGTLTITGPGITIDGGAVWSSTEVANSTREMLSVSSGASATSAAIYVYQTGTVNLTSVTMQNLYTASGQAPAIHGSGDSGTTINSTHVTVNMTSVTIQKCATLSGQSITLFNDCVANLNNCSYLNNYSGGTYAGAIKAGGPTYFSQLNMTNCSASGNYSSGWGGVVLWAANNTCGNKTSKATIDGCTFTNNKARYLGGALSNEAIMEVKNTTIKNNIAMAGGGIATFPFTLTETHEGGGNACGLTLGSGNLIENNTAYATGNFTPFSSTEAGANGDDKTITNQITYTGGGGGVWCYMDKPGWTCSLNIGEGNSLISNDANNVGGGVYVHNVASAGTTLEISGATISQNTAPNGGGVAVKDATVSIDSGAITNNVAATNGGGIYVDNGTCTVSGTGSVSENSTTNGNGGGIYIKSGSLTVSGGVITVNKAQGAFTGTTAKDATSGVGGGIYVLSGEFSMSGDHVGLHSNTASVAANDAYATGGTATTLTLPDVEKMDLAGWTGTGKPEGWFADYMKDDTNYPASIIKDEDGNNTVNRGRYNYYDEDKVEVLYDTVLATNKTTYYCLTIGTPHPGYGNLWITKTLNSPAKENQTFIFEVTGKTRKPETDYSLTVTLVIEKGETTAQVLVANIPDGTYTVTEKEAWSWRYDQTSRQFHPKDGVVISETQFTVAIEDPEWVADFTNSRTDPYWLSGDSYCENWWGGTGETKINKREEHY